MNPRPVDRKSRRQFLRQMGWGLLGVLGAQVAQAQPELKITQAMVFRLPLRRIKLVGRNAQRRTHGERSWDRVLLLRTNTGVEGLGHCRAPRQAVAQLIGKNPFSFRHQGEFRSPLGSSTMALWDLAGKVLGKPVYELLGNQGHPSVPVYDGSIYFADLLPQFEHTWPDRFRWELDVSWAMGHRAVKVKVGRGHRWMPRHQGDRRDVEVLRLIRNHAGEELTIAIDANNGYTPQGAKRLLEQVGPLKLAFVEELFPEEVETCCQFRQWMRCQGWETLLADGETQHRLEAYRPFMEAKAIDVFQGDMNFFGVEGIVQEAHWAAQFGLQVAPHNWGSLIGFYCQLHLGRALPNFYMAEHDPLVSRVLLAPGYGIQDGRAVVPDSPGFGLVLDHKRLRQEAQVEFQLQA